MTKILAHIRNFLLSDLLFSARSRKNHAWRALPHPQTIHKFALYKRVREMSGFAGAKSCRGQEPLSIERGGSCKVFLAQRRSAVQVNVRATEAMHFGVKKFLVWQRLFPHKNVLSPLVVQIFPSVSSHNYAMKCVEDQ